MDISFNIIFYTEAETMDEWLSLQQNKVEINSKKPLTIKNIVQTMVIVLLILLLLPSIFSFPPQQYSPFIYCLFIFLLILLFRKFYLIFKSKHEISKGFEYFDERILFSEDEFRIKSSQNERNMKFLYKEIQDFLFCYKEDITILKWKTNTTTYQYTIYSNQVQRDLIQVLEHIYAQNVPVREIDEIGRKLNLLELVDKPIPKIDDKYQRLIDEIGEKD